MPLVWEEFTETELTDALAETRWQAEAMLTLAHDLETKLPGTKAAFRAGMLRQSKVQIIANGTANLTPAEARAVEALVLGRAGRLTPGGLRSAVASAVIQVAPDKARTRREEGARNARVQRWLEDFRQRRPDGPRAAPGRGAGRGPAHHLVGGPAPRRGPGRRYGPAEGPRLPGHSPQ
jgi:hypothetical protein